MFVKFEYTNKTDEPVNFQSNFSLSVSQNGTELDTLQVWNGEADASAIMNYYDGTAVNETLPVHYPVILKDYSPVSVTVSAVSEGKTIVQTMVIDVEVPEGVIIPNEAVTNPVDLVADWININNGDSLTINEGRIDPSTNIMTGFTEYTPADNGLSSWTSGQSYKIEGDILTLGEERFRITKENDKLYLTGLDSETSYMRKNDFYKFEDLEVHHIGDTVSTDAVEFTLSGYGYNDAIDPVSLGGNVALFHKDMLIPDNGMVWAKISYDLFNISNQKISMQSFENNVRFAVVYRENFTFEMDKYSNNYITKGYGGDDHVEWLSSSSSPLGLPSLIRESFDTWLPVAPAVQEDAEAPLHILVILPKTSGTQIFVYDVQNSDDTEASAPAESDADSDFYGTWEVTEIATSDNSILTVAEMEENSVFSWSDWEIIVSETDDVYLQTNNTSTSGAATISGNSITAGNNQWTLEGDKLLIVSGNTKIYYEKISSEQVFPELEKSDLIALLIGTWDINSSERSGYFEFGETSAEAVINDVVFHADTLCVDTDSNKIYISSVDSGVNITMDLNYSYSDGALSLDYSGDTLTKQ